MTKLNDHDRCACGSGEPGAMCCQRDRLRGILESMAEDRQLRDRYTAKHGHTRRPVGIDFNGKKVFLIGGSIYQQAEPGPYNFANLAHDTALELFGDVISEAKEVATSHPALQWMHAFVDRHAIAPDVQDGNAAAWIRFGYDLFSIRDNAQLQRDLKRRLIDPDTFQAARYELKVAALFATAGFDLHFENERDTSKRHPEFVGIARRDGTKIAVEVKSRHRKGVLGFNRGTRFEPGADLGIRNLVLKAYEKCTDLPFYVFVDVNLPPVNESGLQCWQDDLNSTMQNLADDGYASPCAANAIFFTNDPSHFVGSAVIGEEADRLWIQHFEPINSRVPHPDGDIVSQVLLAYSQRVAPPTRFYENP